MKIAICFSGHIRQFFDGQNKQFEENIASLTQSGHSVSLFFSVWDTFNGESFKNKAYDHENSRVEISEETFKDLSSRYDLTFEIEEYKKVRDNFVLSKYHPTIKPESDLIINHQGILFPISMFYKVWRANCLKKDYETKNGFLFDVVVRYRANLRLDKLMNFDHVKPNSFYSFSHGYNEHSRGPSVPSSLMTQDMFFYGDSKTIDTVCDLYNNVGLILHKYEGTPSYIGPERLLYDWIVYENGIHHEKCDISFDYWY